MKYYKKKAFTLLEILFVSILISAGLLFVAESIRHAKEVNYGVIQGVIANQLATEGIEMVYQLRNTNFLKYDLTTDKADGLMNSCWLASNFEKCTAKFRELTRNASWNSLERSEIKFLQSGYYYITNSGGINILNRCVDNNESDSNYNCKGTNCCSKIGQDFYAICQKDGSRVPCTGGHVAGNDESNYGRFYRYIEGIGNYNMNSNNTGGTLLNPRNLNDNVDAQEFRFCSRVFRVGMQGGEIEICSTMTNFIE